MRLRVFVHVFVRVYVCVCVCMCVCLRVLPSVKLTPLCPFAHTWTRLLVPALPQLLRAAPQRCW